MPWGEEVLNSAAVPPGAEPLQAARGFSSTFHLMEDAASGALSESKAGSVWSPGSSLPAPYDAFKVVLEKTLESPSDSKEIQPVHPKGNQLLKLKLQYFGHLMQRNEKTLMVGKIEGRRRRG